MGTKTLSPVEIGKLMGCNPARATMRLVALGYVDVCSRCGGSGRYSWNQMDGDRCFGCGGAGKNLVKITAAIVSEALVRIAAGELASYFAEAAARKAIEGASKALWVTYMSSQIGKDYTAILKTMTAGEFLESPVYRAQTLQNAIMDRAEGARYARKVAHTTRLATILEAHTMIVTLNTAWVAR